MKVSIEITGDVEDPVALIARARRQYATFVAAVDVDGMTDEEALAVADLTAEQRRAHPRYVTPEQAVSDAADTARVLIDKALGEAGVMLESSCTRLLAGRDGLDQGRAAPWRERRPRIGHGAGVPRPSPRRRKGG